MWRVGRELPDRTGASRAREQALVLVRSMPRRGSREVRQGAFDLTTLHSAKLLAIRPLSDGQSDGGEVFDAYGGVPDFQMVHHEQRGYPRRR